MAKQMTNSTKQVAMTAALRERTRSYAGVESIEVGEDRGRLRFADGTLVCVRYGARLVRPKRGENRDYGAERAVIARRSFDHELWWASGFSYVERSVVSRRVPAALTTVFSPQGFDVITPEGVIPRELNGDGVRHSSTKKLAEGGRLSLELLLEHPQAIDAFFGVRGLTALLDPKRTAIVE